MATTNAAIANDAAITLDWADVAGANLYSIQVSLYPDFLVAMESNNALAVSQHAFTDAGTDNVKRYWRWRYSTDGGTTWSAWSEVGSYWLNGSATADFAPSTGQWVLVDPDDVSDRYVMAVAPRHAVVDSMINRVKERNRQGELLSEYITSKAIISLEFPEDGFIEHEQHREIWRFHTDIKTFFLIGNTNNGRDNLTKIWQVQVVNDPEFEMLAPGRQDLFYGSVEYEEV
jgi:hypothetical protein